MIDIYEMCDKAFKQGNFVPIIRADEGYRVPVSTFIPADIPTDWDLALRIGIYKYYEANKDERIVRMCRDSVKKLLNGSAYEIWCAYSFLFYIICNEGKRKAPFYIVDDDLTQLLRDTLQANKDKLSKEMIWEGKNLKEGLWTDIESSSLFLKKKYGFEIL